MGMYWQAIIPLWVVLFPIFMTPAIFILSKRSEKLRDGLSVLTAVITFFSVASLYPFVMEGKTIEYTLFQILPELGVTVRIDILSFCLAILSSFVWMMATIYSLDYMKPEHGKNRYYPVLIFTLGATLGIFFAGDFFTLYVFFELMSLVSYVLIIHEETPTALKAGYKYLIMTIIGGLALFFAIIATFELAGSVSLSKGVLVSKPSTLAFFAFVCYLIGFGMKAGMFPLHVWLPEAHPVAPSPASALLSGIMLKTGAYGMLRVLFYIFNIEVVQSARWDLLVAVLAVITILLGSAVALTQFDLKRRLAYSSIGQMGYVLLGMILFTEQGLVGDIFHIFSHAFMKSTLFLAAGAIIWKTGLRNINDLAGIGRKMPFTMGAFTIAALAMIGIPPLNGFLSKWTLSLGALEAGLPIYVVILLISSLLNGLYYLPIIIAAFFGGEEQEHAHGEAQHVEAGINLRGEATAKMVIPMVILGLGCFFLGLFPSNIAYELSLKAAVFLFRGGM